MIWKKQSGFTLIELIIIIVIVGIIATVATRKMMPAIETAKVEQTKKELDQLAQAITGNPHIYEHGARVDFGYVGDVGALPASLNALTSNPGGYTTWNGPYIETGASGSEYLRDAWGANYVYTGTIVRSVGSGSNIDRAFASSTAELLSNSVMGYLVDADGQVPGVDYRDSVQVRLTYPNGTGGMAAVTINPATDGSFSFSNIPMGNHILYAIYLPENDTLTQTICVLPASTCKVEIVFPADLW